MRSGSKQDAPRGWPLSHGTVRAVLSGHGILGLAFAAIIYLVCLTGALADFAHDIARWEQPGTPSIANLAPGALDRAVRTAQINGPAHQPRWSSQAQSRGSMHRTGPVAHVRAWRLSSSWLP